MLFATSRICASPVTFYNDLLQFLVSDLSVRFSHFWSRATCNITPKFPNVNKSKGVAEKGPLTVHISAVPFLKLISMP